MENKDPKITQEQINQADRLILLMEQMQEMKQKYPVAYKFLHFIYVPDSTYNLPPTPSIETMRHKVIADIVIADEAKKIKEASAIQKEIEKKKNY